MKIVTALTFGLLGFCFSAAVITDNEPKDTENFTHVLCEEEDSVDCFWDAEHQGNGKGRSFWATCNDGTLVVFYVDGQDSKAYKEGC